MKFKIGFLSRILLLKTTIYNKQRSAAIWVCKRARFVEEVGNHVLYYLQDRSIKPFASEKL